MKNLFCLSLFLFPITTMATSFEDNVIKGLLPSGKITHLTYIASNKDMLAGENYYGDLNVSSLSYCLFSGHGARVLLCATAKGAKPITRFDAYNKTLPKNELNTYLHKLQIHAGSYYKILQCNSGCENNTPKYLFLQVQGD